LSVAVIGATVDCLMYW